MDRIEIKRLAKEKIKGNKWNIWWPFLVIIVLENLVSGIFTPTVEIDYTNLETLSTMQVTPTYYVSTGIISIIFAVILAGYYKYLLNFVRTGEFDSKTIIETIKTKWIDVLVAEILVSIIVFFCSLLFVIPGIIMALAYAMAVLLVIDKDVAGNDSLAKSREMMKGYKWDYFVFLLSFLGWIILTPFTIGLLLIWLVPYMLVATMIYYDKLQEKTYK